MVGLAAFGVAATLSLILGLSLTLWEVLALNAGLASFGIVRGLPIRRRTNIASADSDVDVKARRWGAGFIACFFVLLLGRSVIQPLNTWDGFVMWTMKARAIVLLNGLDPHVFGGATYRILHMDYPLFVPALEAGVFRFMGRFDTQVIHVQFWLLLLGFVVALKELLQRRVPPRVLWPSLLLLVLAPSLTVQLETAYADIPEALFIALAAVAGWFFITERRISDGFQLAAYAGAAAAIKQEGWTFVAAVIATLAIVALPSLRTAASLICAAVPALVVAAAWLAWVRFHHVTSWLPLGKALDPTYLWPRVGRLGPTVPRLVKEMTLPGSWLIVIPLTVAASALALKQRRNYRLVAFVAVSSCLMLVALSWAIWVAPVSVRWELTTAAPRITSAIVIIAAAFLPLIATVHQEGPTKR